MWNQIGEHSILQGRDTSNFFLLLDTQDLTHYFVMTAKKESLLSSGVLKEDIPDDDGPKGRGK